MIKQKLFGLGFMILGWCTAPIAGDATFAVFATMIGLSAILSKDCML